MGATAETIQHLQTITDRTALLERMQAIDPNGCYTDRAADAEGLDPTTMEEAQAMLADWLENHA